MDGLKKKIAAAVNAVAENLRKDVSAQEFVDLTDYQKYAVKERRTAWIRRFGRMPCKRL
ncbi:MAG: hypothetical protein IJ317_05675 [Clostridia bacterium]|nr:hypothetical protein [Clostridia bacterium]